MKKIYMNDLLIELNYIDARAVRAWCRKNNVLLTKNGKAEYVFESALKEALEKPFIKKLKLEFGNEWESAYNLYASGNIPALNTLQRISDVRYKTFIPKSSVENRYRDQFNQYAKSKKAA